jgi:hypothetical protein
MRNTIRRTSGSCHLDVPATLALYSSLASASSKKRSCRAKRGSPRRNIAAILLIFFIFQKKQKKNASPPSQAPSEAYTFPLPGTPWRSGIRFGHAQRARTILGNSLA